MRKLETFDKNRDRLNPEKAQELFEFLWPDRATRKACAMRLARSIECAHEAADASWAVSAFNSNITLNVGQVCVLWPASDKVRVYIRGSSNKSVYKGRAVPGPSEMRVELPEKIATIPRPIWEEHETFIRAAAKAKKVSPFKKSFSEGVLIYLESLLDVELPRPSYLVSTFHLPEEIRGSELYEGIKQQVFVNRYERNPIARRACIAHYGNSCEVCKFDFEQVYGAIGRGYIHVHHIVPLSAIGASYRIDPVRDLRPVCPNCHAMLHMEPELQIATLQRRLRKLPRGPAGD